MSTPDPAPPHVIAVVGLGYVGLPLSRQFASSGNRVIGLDIDPEKVDALQRGESYIKHIPSSEIDQMVTDGRFSASTDFARVTEASAIVICVPTPLSQHREPDISYVLSTARSIAPHLRRGQLVSLESTTYPGTTDEDLRAALEEGSGLTAGEDFHLCYSPEREDPGNAASVETIPKLVSGLTPACLKLAQEVYGNAIHQLVPVTSPRVAEATKLLENIFRSVNIALVNELKVVFSEMDIDIWEVIEAAKTKPFGFMPFYPGPGLGGHCIPIDPFYLTWKAREYGQHTRFIELAGEINTRMPAYVLEHAVKALNEKERSLRGSRILIVGLAYKPNVDDMRESPALALMDLLHEGGAEIDYFDPHIPEIGPTREHAEWQGARSIPFEPDRLTSYDLAIIVTDHENVDYGLLVEAVDSVLDTRNALAKRGLKPRSSWKA